MTRTYLLKFLTAILIWLGVISCQETQPIDVALLAPLTRFSVELGSQGRNGAILAVEKINAEGGIHGRPLRLLIQDVGGGPDSCEAILRSQLNNGVQYFVGPYTSNMAPAAMKAMKNSGAFLISPSMTSDMLDGKDDEIFRLQPSNYMQSRAILKLIRQKGYKRIATVYDASNREYSLSLVDSLTHEFQRNGGQVVYADSIVPGVRTPTHVGQSLASAPVEAIFIVTTGSQLAILTQAARKNGQNAEIFAGSWGMTPDVISQGGVFVDGITFSAPAPPAGSTERNIEFERLYIKRFGTPPSFIASESWEAIQLLTLALRNTDPAKPDMVKKYLLKQTEFQGVYDNFNFNATGDVVRPQTLVKIQHHEFQVLEMPK